MLMGQIRYWKRKKTICEWRTCQMGSNVANHDVVVPKGPVVIVWQRIAGTLGTDVICLRLQIV